MRISHNCGILLSSALLSLALVLPLAPALGDEPLKTGPQTESRFPPLVVPPGFKATLFACDPLVEYPSVIALGPRPGTLLVAHDYLTGLGVEIVRRDEIRLLEDADGDGYADRSTLFADGFNSIQGLAYHAGTVYAMHAPLLTALKDTDGDGKADERRDLLVGLGLPPEKNTTRLHCANGIVAGHDGWLYLAMGDNGTEVARPEGDRLVLHAGGILRCRADGRDLHVFSSGLRNIYDVTLDEEANVFVRDNENDGGDYMVRVCLSLHGADHGYPYLYDERPAEAMPPLADLGRGSSAGVACYLETAFPPEFRGNLFCCEWGKSVVRYERQRIGGSFAPMKEIEFAAGAADDPYGFKPTDIIVDRDGSLLVSDWCDGQRPKRGRGRIYRISYSMSLAGQPLTPGPSPARGEGREDAASGGTRDRGVLISQLDSPSYHARVAAQEALQQLGGDGVKAAQHALRRKEIGAVARLHCVWILARAGGQNALPALFALAESDEDASVRAQAVRAIADLSDPVLVQHRLDAGRGDAEIAARLAMLAKIQDPRVALEAVIAMGRLHWRAAPHWLRENFHSPDAAMSHVAMQALRRSDNWPAVLKLLDEPDERPIREIALRALADRAEAPIVDGLIDRLQRERQPQRRQQYADALTRVFKQPAPWTYWGYRPPPRPANTVAWERTEAIERVLDGVLADADRDVRMAILRRMQREQIPTSIATLAKWLPSERAAVRVGAILDSLAKAPVDATRDLLAGVIGQREYTIENRRAALSQFIAGLTEHRQPQLLELAQRVEDGPVLAELLVELSKRPKIDCRPLLLAKLASPEADVRAAAVAACAKLGVSDAVRCIPGFLKDPDSQVRFAAAAAAGSLDARECCTALTLLAADKDPAMRAACLASLRQLRDPSAVGAAVATLDNPVTQLAAIDYLAEFGGPQHAAALAPAAASNRSIEIISAVVRALANWEAREPADSPRRRDLQSAVAEVQGQSGVLLQWRAAGPLDAEAAAKLLEPSAQPFAMPIDARSLLASGSDAKVELTCPGDQSTAAVWLAVAEASLAEPTKAQFLASSDVPLAVFVNGRLVFRREKAAAFQADSNRFEAELVKGANQVAVQVGAAAGGAQFHVRFRRLSTSAEHERLAQHVLQNTGDVARGQAVFLNAEKSQCLKCHRLGDQGGAIGPNLSGVGSRFSRIHLIESILDPSRTIAPSYETIGVALADGRTVAGVKVAEDETTLTLGDETGKRHEIPKREIEERETRRRSTMPEGLEKRLSDRDLLDLVTFLLAEKKPPPR